MSGRDDGALSIGVLSARAGVSVRALRHYEQNGLLPSTRTAAGHRRFSTESVESVRRIRLFLDAGLPLTVVSQVLPCFTDDGARLDACVADYLREHMSTLSERIEHLDAQRGTVQRLQQLVTA